MKIMPTEQYFTKKFYIEFHENHAYWTIFHKEIIHRISWKLCLL